MTIRKTNISSELLRIVNEALLDQYKDIGAFMQDFTIPNYYKRFLAYFSYAEKELKKPVVSSWLLKCVAIYSTCDYLLHNQDNAEFFEGEQFNQIRKRMYKLTKGMIKDSYDLTDMVEVHRISRGFDPAKIKQSLIHYLSFNIDEINGYSFGGKHPDKVFADLEEILKSFNESENKFYLNDAEEKKAYGNKIEDYLVFPNGWKWVWKHFNECREFESKYGGENHCGTARGEDELLSLREPTGNGMYKIWATFSIDPGGYLVQRKGTTEEVNKSTGKVRARYGNQNPDPKIHDYIYDLLVYGHKDGKINGFYSSSDYASDKDFVIDDLEDEKKREHLNSIMEEKKYYESFYDELEEEGLTDRMLDLFEYGTGIKFIDRGENGNSREIETITRDQYWIADEMLKVLLSIEIEGFYDYPDSSLLSDTIHALEESDPVDEEGVRTICQDTSNYSFPDIFKYCINHLYNHKSEIFGIDEESEDNTETNALYDYDHIDYKWLMTNRKEQFVEFLNAIESCFNEFDMLSFFINKVGDYSYSANVNLTQNGIAIKVDDDAIIRCLYVTELDELGIFEDIHVPRDFNVGDVHCVGRYLVECLCAGESFDNIKRGANRIVSDAIEGYCQEILADEVYERIIENRK